MTLLLRRQYYVIRQLKDATQVEILSIQVGPPRSLGRPDAADPIDRVWTTGFFKEPVVEPVWLGRTNLSGDGQADLQNHGGLEKAVNNYPSEHHSYWETELGIARLPHGAFGENFTTAGLLESAVCIGDVFEIGRALVQVSQPRQPCWKLARRWQVKDLALRVQQTGRTGWYFRVLREGLVEAGERFVLSDRLHPEWTVAAANEVMHHNKADIAAARGLGACVALSTNWRETLALRVATGAAASNVERLDGRSG